MKQPQTLTEAVTVLKTILKEKELNQIKQIKEEDVNSLHFSLGNFIRNNFGLWRDNPALLKDCGKEHPDDASSVIINELWKSLQDN